jgi:hypothetical protein
MWIITYLSNIAGFLTLFVVPSVVGLFVFTKQFLMVQSAYDSDDMPHVTQCIYDKIRKDMLLSSSQLVWKNAVHPAGFILGRNFIADVEMYSVAGRRYISIKLYTPRFAKKTIESDIVNRVEEIEDGHMVDSSCRERIPLLMKRGIKYECNWDVMNVSPYRSRDMVPSKSVEACQSILGIMKQQGHIGGVFLCCGAPGTGKTMTARLLTEKLSGVLCADFNPTKPACTLFSIIKACPPTRDRPLVVVIEEVDKSFDTFGRSLGVADFEISRTQVPRVHPGQPSR